jgi:gamma-glutamyltranspeptidase / glutathione hydrolase
MRRVCVTLAVVLLGAAWWADAAAAKRAVAVGSGGAVVSDNAIATDAGLGVLRRGGTAADAAVAVASTLGVTEPFVAGIGGGGYFVYYDARARRVYTIDGRETAPVADNASLFIDPSTGQPLPFATEVTSGLSVGVPGTLMTWRRALEHWGRFTLAADLKPAERVARSGFGIDGILRQEIEWNAARFGQFSSTRALFLPGGPIAADRLSAAQS